MRWRKLGHVYAPDGSKPWARAYAANPTAIPLGGDRFRIYFSARDDDNRSSIGWVEIDITAPDKILAESDEPVISPGESGQFDDCGCSIGCITPVGDKLYLYYMGWHLTKHVPWQNALGLAISEGPGQAFRKWPDNPVIPLDETDPHTISYPWVIVENGRFRMWYGSNIAWGTRKEDMRHLLKYAESSDGLHWIRKDEIVVDFAYPDEFAICRPCVVKDGGDYKMWFCSRGDSYRIRYAESGDGKVWQRHDQAVGIDVSPEGWDSEMIEYPSVIDHKGERYLLYTGNQYGRNGFGLAVLETR